MWLTRRLYKALQRHALVDKLRTMRQFARATAIDVMRPAGGRRALVLAAHPDDEATGCGGTVKLLTERGSVVDAAIMTDGQRGGPPDALLSDTEQRELGAQRRREAEASARILGIGRVFSLGGTDGSLHLETALATELRARLREGRYDLVLCPWPHEQHGDHVATFEILRRAIESSPVDVELWVYEIWTPLLPNAVVDITTTIEAKVEAIRAHASQTVMTDYGERFRALARYRGIIHRPVADYAEAFVRGDARLLRAF